MRRSAVLFAVLSATLLLAAEPAHAQGSDPVTFRSGGTSQRRQYEARVRAEVDNLKSRWAQAWEGDNAAALSELYTRDAV
ncbi:MAG TPA: hypothetical protein VFQ39_12855, partial [Longimicrobium sp.]|nr:hypothetical protein [Longimicrobium sp.]